MTIDYIKLLNFLKKLQQSPVKIVETLLGKKSVAKTVVEP
jgi:hypothetical protein